MKKCDTCIHRPRRKSLREFSKKIIVALTFMWFIGALLGVAVVITQIVRGDMTVDLSALLIFIDAPMTGGILGYMLKSAAENKEKIKGIYLPENEE